MTHNLITTLIAQHNELRAQMRHLDVLALSGKNAAGETVTALAAFKQTLAAHLLLENTQFYPVVLEKFKQKETETKSLLRFIEEMKSIEKTALSFLGRCDIAEAIVDQSGGAVWFESEENKGATFTLALPATKEMAEEKVVRGVFSHHD